MAVCDIDGEPCVVCGVWWAVCGVWCGVWCMVGSVWCVVGGGWPGRQWGISISGASWDGRQPARQARAGAALCTQRRAPAKRQESEMTNYCDQITMWNGSPSKVGAISVEHLFIAVKPVLLANIPTYPGLNHFENY